MFYYVRLQTKYFLWEFLFFMEIRYINIQVTITFLAKCQSLAYLRISKIQSLCFFQDVKMVCKSVARADPEVINGVLMIRLCQTCAEKQCLSL